MSIIVLAAAVLFHGPGDGLAQGPQPKLMMLDYVIMADGYGLEEREIYDAKVAPIVARHGIRRVASLDVLKVLKGPKALARIDVWVLPNAAALGAWGKDPDYVAITPYRNRIHAMNRIALYFARLAGRAESLGTSAFLAEMHAFGAGFDKAGFVDYVKRSDAVARQSGIKRAASFRVLKKITRAGVKAQWMNLWRLPSPKHFANWHRGEAFKALGTARNRLFDLSQSIFVLVRSRG